jgi:hypothetical protein
MPISICMANTVSTSRKHTHAKACVRFDHQDDGTSAQNFSVSPKKPTDYLTKTSSSPLRTIPLRMSVLRRVMFLVITPLFMALPECDPDLIGRTVDLLYLL